MGSKKDGLRKMDEMLGNPPEADDFKENTYENQRPGFFARLFFRKKSKEKEKEIFLKKIKWIQEKNKQEQKEREKARKKVEVVYAKRPKKKTWEKK